MLADEDPALFVRHPDDRKGLSIAPLATWAGRCDIRHGVRGEINVQDRCNWVPDPAGTLAAMAPHVPIGIDGSSARGEQADVGETGPAVRDVVRVQQFAPATASGYAELVPHRCIREVADHCDRWVQQLRRPQECDAPLRTGIGAKPPETFGPAIQGVEGRQLSIERVQCLNENLHTAVETGL